MTDIGSSLALLRWAVAGCFLATLSSVSLAHADGRIWRVVEPSQGMPSCEEFYDKWEVPGAPPAMMAMFGLGREVIAAKSCLDKGDVATACKHWQGLLAVMDKIGPPLDESRGDVEALMTEHKCETASGPAADSASESAPASAPTSEPAPDSEPKPQLPASGAPAGNPAADK
jgi:hypothetical protein